MSTSASATKPLPAFALRAMRPRSLPRQIDRLLAASFCERPTFIPVAKRRTGSRATGASYEKKLVRSLKRNFPQAKYHQWIHFMDATGPHYCEPELFIERKAEVILLEAKLTGGPLGRMQMEGLYKPLLEKIIGKPVRCLLVCKNVTVETPGPFIASLEAFINSDLPFATWHWLA
jgi:hypothetical protein